MAKVIRTPRGTARYPWLAKADDKFGDATYKVDLIVPVAEAQPLADKLEAMFTDYYEAKLEETGKKKLRTEDLPFEEDDNGNIVFKLKLKKRGFNSKTKEEWENKLAFFDAKGKPIEGKLPTIGGGSVLRISFEPNLWEVSGKLGLQLRMKAVMVIDPKSGGGAAKSADEYGFEAEEGGYEYNPASFDESDGEDPEDF